MTRLRPRALDVLSGVLALVAVVLLVRQTGDSVASIAPRLPAVEATISAPVALVDTITTSIITRNVFSATRRAPTVRFAPPGAELPAPTAMMATPSVGDSAADSAAVTDDSPPRLYGIVAQDGVRHALLLLTATGDAPRLYAVGERRGGYRVFSITPDQVVLVTPTGTRTLRLAPRAQRDSLENMP